MSENLLSCKKCSQSPLALHISDLQNNFIRYVCRKCDMLVENDGSQLRQIGYDTWGSIYCRYETDAIKQWNETNAK